MKTREIDQGTPEGKLVSNEPKAPDGGRPGGFEVAEADGLENAPQNDSTPSSAELRDFLAADHLESHADPGFKERLRKWLWAFIRNRYGSGSSPPDSS